MCCKYWAKIEETTKRLEKNEYLAKMLIRILTEYPADLSAVLLLLENRVQEPWLGQAVLNLGEQAVKKAMQEAFQVENKIMKEDYMRVGDLGMLAQQYKARQPKPFITPKQLSVGHVLLSFQRISEIQGSESTKDKIDVIKRLFADASDLEAKYLVRLLLGKNRLGIQRKTLLFALSEMVCYIKLSKDGQINPYSVDLGLKIVDWLNTVWANITRFQVTNRIVDAAEDELDEISGSDNDEEADDISNAQNFMDESLCLEELLKLVKTPTLVTRQTNPRAASYLEVLKAFARVPSLGFVAKNASNLSQIQITPGIPILPMLAKPTASYDEIFDKLSGAAFACEYKYDGFRAQVHCVDGRLKIFSRGQEDMSARFPDVLSSVKSAVQAKVDFVIDGEIVPVTEEGEIAPFQMLSRRLKKYDEQSSAGKITMFCFDIMLCGNNCLMDLPFQQRRAILHKLIKETELIKYATSRDVKSAEELSELLMDAVNHKTEGLIVKTLVSRYCPDRRSRHWLKLKKDYLEGVGDSLDLVPVAAWYGRGKRAGVVGAYLLAARNGSYYETVTQIGTGFSDLVLQELTAFYSEEKQKKSKPAVIKAATEYETANRPDFWIDPADSKVFEVKVANLSLSAAHTCSARLVEGELRGIAARLPRLIRIRTDKDTSDCSTASFVNERFNAQPDRIASKDEFENEKELDDSQSSNAEQREEIDLDE